MHKWKRVLLTEVLVVMQAFRFAHRWVSVSVGSRPTYGQEPFGRYAGTLAFEQAVG